MISLFDGDFEKENAKLREQYRDRLKEIADQHRVQVVTEQAKPEETAGNSQAGSPEPVRQQPDAAGKTNEAARPGPVSTLERSDKGEPDQFQEMAERITVKLVDALTVAVKELHGLTEDGRERLEEGFAAMAAISADIRNLTGEFTALRQQADSAAQSERTLSLKQATMDARLREQEENRQLMKEKLQLLERRLETQAETIRALHSVVREWGSRQEELRVTLQKLGGISGTSGVPVPLPEDL
jgi:hypothetical protein